MRQILIAGNWKMNLTISEGKNLVKEIEKEIKNPKCEILVCPTFTSIFAIKSELKNSKIKIGGQDCREVDNGAHTGDISAELLKDAGAEYVILGHSERRTNHLEPSILIKNKAEKALRTGLKTIICIGETKDERLAGITEEVCAAQLKGSVPKEASADNTVIAYEPVWAIGTGLTPTLEEIESVHKFIRKTAAEFMGKDAADKIRILYGGSMNPANAKDILALENIDGGLIGGASLKIESFLSIINAV